jgi:nucleotide-binding universal stress UspA family protein
MVSKLLIPLDGSELSARALDTALAIARKEQAEVKLLRVLDKPWRIHNNPQANVQELAEQLVQLGKEEARAYFNELAKDARFNDLDVEISIVEGNPASVILDTAVTDESDLIVMSSHGYSGATRWMMGSVSQRVLRHATAPVLVIRTAAPIEHLLIPLDGSPLSESALEPGLNMAEILGADVTLFRVADAGELDITEAYLTRLAEKHGRESLTININAQAKQDIAQAILNVAEERHIQGIVMATHGRTGVTRWIYGSVTEKVLRHTKTCSMLVIRAN